MSTYQNVLLIGVRRTYSILHMPPADIHRYKISILSRLNSSSAFPAGIPVFKADYNSVDSFLPAMRGQDVVICMVGGQASGNQNVLIDAALAAGERRVRDGDFAGIMDLTQGAAFGMRGLGDERKRGTWNERLGLQEDSLDEAVRRVLLEAWVPVLYSSLSPPSSA